MLRYGMALFRSFKQYVVACIFVDIITYGIYVVGEIFQMSETCLVF